MTAIAKPFVVLMAEDSEHDIRAVERVWKKHAIPHRLEVVHDGAECMDYLLRRGNFSDGASLPRPGVLLLDINMPRMDGLEVLRQIRASPELRRLPVVILTTSRRKEDIEAGYDLGANAYIQKPVGMENLSRTLQAINVFWESAELPDHDADGRA